MANLPTMKDWRSTGLDVNARYVPVTREDGKSRNFRRKKGERVASFWRRISKWICAVRLPK